MPPNKNPNNENLARFEVAKTAISFIEDFATCILNNLGLDPNVI